MAVFSVNNIKIIGMSACVPKQEDNNWNYNILSEQEKKLLIKTTGIEKKRIADNLPLPRSIKNRQYLFNFHQ